MQDTRGRFESEGTFYIYLHEAEDGYDTVEWAAAEPWSNGDVGTFGGSYLASTQMSLAVEAPPHLKAMFIRVSTANYWEDGAGSGGAFALLHNLAYAMSLASTSKEAQADPARGRALAAGIERDNLAEWVRAYPFYPNTSPVELIPTYQRWFQDWGDHSDYDDYWKQNGYTFEAYYDRIPDIPIYFVGGWYDIFLRGTLKNFAGLAARHSSPTKLMVGPWEHGVGSVRHGDVAFGQRCIAGKIFGCNDNLPLSARRDVLVFQTPPLEEDVAVMGPITVKLWVSSSARDTDFTAKLVDVHPPSEDYPWGYDMLLADRIVRARYRNSLEVPELMEPGQIYEIPIDLLGVANRFKAGHRIRLDISSSNFPFFDVNPNTGERPGYHTHTVKATIRVSSGIA